MPSLKRSYSKHHTRRRDLVRLSFMAITSLFTLWTVSICYPTRVQLGEHPVNTTSDLVEAEGVKEVARLTAPIFAMPRLCNERNTQPLTPRPAEYDPSIIDVVVGIMSPDNEMHASLRTAQRDSWFHYRDVARPANGFRGRLYVEYFFGRSFDNNYTFTDALHRESAEHADILVMDINEPERIPKELLTSGSYGIAPEVTMGFKALAFYCYAERVYGHAKFVVKADDDEFIRVPVVMRTVDSMPSYGVFWTTRTHTEWGKRKEGWRFCGASGMWVAMTRDVLHMLNSLHEIQQYGSLTLDGDAVYNGSVKVKTLQWLYYYTPFHAEDVIPAAAVAHFVRRSRLPRKIGLEYEIFYYDDPVCRLHNHNNETSKQIFIYFVNPMSMIIHHASSSEQQDYLRFFPEGKAYDTHFYPGDQRFCRGVPMLQTRICAEPNAKIHL